jgi:acetyl esterase/lipase
VKDNPGNNTTPLGYESHSYGTDPLQKFHLFMPDSLTDSTEVVVLVHGGGWVWGYQPNQEVHNFDNSQFNIQDSLLKRGYVCAVMKYRLACYKSNSDSYLSNHMYNQNRMMEDIDLAILKLKELAATNGFNAENFHLIGESAGGHLVTSYAVRSDSDADVKSVTSMFGPTKLDDNGWLQYLNLLPNQTIESPTYMRVSDNNCDLRTNKTMPLLGWVKSFSNTENISLTGPNARLTDLSPAYVDNINNDIPLFITHGDNDLLVPVSHGPGMFQAIENKYGDQTSQVDDFTVRYKKKIYTDCGHGWSGNSCNRSLIVSDVLSWVEGH